MFIKKRNFSMNKILNKIPKPILQYGWIIILILVLSVFAFRPLRVLTLQARAGELIETVVEDHASGFDHYFICQIPAFVDLPAADERLIKAVALLQRAHSIRPETPQTNLLLGQSACLQGNFLQAVEALETFSRTRPDNPLGNLEAAFAYISLSLLSEDLTKAEQEMKELHAKQILNDLGVEITYPVSQGNTAFEKHAYRNKLFYRIAWYWYRTGNILGPLSERNAFRLALLDVINRHEIPLREQFRDIDILVLEEMLNIAPASFFRISNGQPVDLYNDGGAAIYYVNSDVGGAFVQVKKDGQYCLSVAALDRPPETTKIEMAHNLNQLLMLDLPNGDNTWQTFETELYLEEGYHLISFRLTNDSYQETEDGGIDRNGYVGEVVIKRCD